MNQRKNRKIFSRSLGASLLLHLLALVFFQQSSLWFSSKALETGSQPSWKTSMEMAQKQHILKEAFEPLCPSQSPEPVPTSFQVTSHTEVMPIEEKIAPFHASSLETILLSEPIPFSLSLPPTKTFPLFEHLPKDLILPSVSATPLLSLSPAPLASHHPSLSPSFPEAKETASLTPSVEGLPDRSWDSQPSLGKEPTFFPSPQLPKLPTLSELETLSYADVFDVELNFLPRDQEGGYFFALTLIPRLDLKLPKLAQHYLFLIDRSNSIQSERLFSTKNAVRRSLEELEEDDLFNIFVFDNKVEKFSSHELAATRSAIAQAEKFLDTIKLGSFFSSSDLYQSLLPLVPAQVKEGEIYTALLFTDGEALGKKAHVREILHHWTQYNSGRLSLFPIGLSSDAHLATLDVAAHFNKGKLLYAPTHRGIKRKALKTMKSIHSPVAKNLQASAVPLTPQTEVRLYPSASVLPHLYLNEPYVILGTCNTLDDFILFLQGRTKDRWLNIKKRISFLNGKKGGHSLKSEWALQCAYEQYAAFLIDGNTDHLAQARLLLEPHQLQVALE